MPRYARVNTCLTDLATATSSCIDDGFKLVENIDCSRYRQMEKGTFTVDPHIPNLLVFAPKVCAPRPFVVEQGNLSGAEDRQLMSCVCVRAGGGGHKHLLLLHLGVCTQSAVVGTATTGKLASAAYRPLTSARPTRLTCTITACTSVAS